MGKQKQGERPEELGPHREAKRAFEKLKKEMAALAPEELVRTNVDVGRAVGIAIAAQPKIAKLIPELEELPGFSAGAVGGLREVALAAWYAHSASREEVDEGEVTRLAAEAYPLRQALRVQAEALADRDLLSREAVAAIGGGKGHRELANGLVALANVFADAGDALEGQTPVTRAELDRAADLGTQLMLALGAREVAPLSSDAAGDLRARAFTLLSQRYEALRRAVSYVRWYQGDAREIAPSLQGTRHRRRVMSEVEETPAPTPEPATSAAPPPRDS